MNKFSLGQSSIAKCLLFLNLPVFAIAYAAMRNIIKAVNVVSICTTKKLTAIAVGLFGISIALAAEPPQASGIVVEGVTASPEYLPEYARAAFGSKSTASIVTYGSPAAAKSLTDTELLNQFGRQLAPSPGAEARADFDGTRGAARLSSEIDMIGATGATITVYDRLEILPDSGPLTFRLRVDSLSMSAQGPGAVANFFVGAALYDGDGYDIGLVGFGFTKEVDASGISSEFGFSFAGVNLTQLDHQPTLVERSFTFTPPAGALLLRWQISGGTESWLGTGAAQISAFHTAYLGIDGNYTSQAGFSYPGFQAPIPEPTTSLLMFVGLIGLGAVKYRARKNSRTVSSH
ncbi:PEP-CTERM sorting domain-containing protein [Paucibacter sp. PLA-PC-4]|uniref:PEP-CTERM sorting domain-containing protein n=1 Tax=Paucibacter sp. PLA-PC-4 TaxID=2993655 RepID=UPI00224AB757|nr:PEP-CTERM sorting domain-containing protein [Paucibacter sp. PLA-PC-4]MCX2863611.1 PEP-CTERM sorting domain-containing protein [Paucibacter sp. PLA-PC-4]